jgi:signal transduction histidine kinase
MTRGTSLRTKVPLYIGAGLAVVIAVWSWLNYGIVKRASLEVGRQHLEGVVNQFSNAYQSNSKEWARTIRTFAATPVITAFVQKRGLTDETAARALIATALGSTYRRIEIFALDGAPILAATRANPQLPLLRRPQISAEMQKALQSPDYGTVAPLQAFEDSVVMPIVVAVLKDSVPIGFMLATRRVMSGAQTARQTLSSLIGGDAQIYVGNANGDVWIDLSGARAQFPVALPLDGSASHYKREDHGLIAAGKAVPNTPWAIAIEMSDRAMLAAPNSVLRQSVALGIVVLLIATIAAWRLSRRTTEPLHSLTLAAQAIAEGDYSKRVKIDRTDEIGVLADSFNRMARDVSSAQTALESKVNERTAQLSARNEDLEAFAHSVSHDLRAPLRAMHGFSQALLEDCSAGMDETAKDYARRIATASQRMDQLTQDLLTFSQVSRGDIALGSVDLDLVLRDAIGQLEADISTKKARVDLQGPFPRVCAHRATLEQALANLVSNGLKFVAPGQSPQIQVRTERSNGSVRVWVEDNGIGIDPVHHRRIFAVFERLHQADKYAGTGIGLAIVRKAVERMGGKVGVESTPGNGSRFWIELQPAEAA